MQKKILNLLCFIVFFTSSTLFAKIQLPTVLSHNMVLQQKSQVKLWGKATPNSCVNVKTSWSGQNFVTQSDFNGKWQLVVSTPSAGGPYEISITDGEEVILKDILIGEVCLCLGQSNMALPLKGRPGQPVEGANEILVKAKETFPLRVFTVACKSSELPQDDVTGKWLKPSAENLQNSSAVAYFYGQLLQEVLNVPVGLIVSAYSGSKIESWLPESPSCDLYNAMVYPLKDYTLKGFLWYQGESNCVDPQSYSKYFPLFPKSLREVWGLGELPFYYVQIAPYAYQWLEETAAARVREVQLKNEKLIPNAGMVVTLDLGVETCNHPPKKKEVGHRLAYLALAKTYHHKGFGYQSPTYESIEVKDNEIIITFDYTSSYCIAPIYGKLEGFEIAASDRVFYPAEAKIDYERRKVIVSAKNVSNPIAVRYAFKNYTRASLFDDYGLPVSSFRSDDW